MVILNILKTIYFKRKYNIDYICIYTTAYKSLSTKIFMNWKFVEKKNV